MGVRGVRDSVCTCHIEQILQIVDKDFVAPTHVSNFIYHNIFSRSSPELIILSTLNSKYAWWLCKWAWWLSK